MGDLKLPSPFLPNGVVSYRGASRSLSSSPPLPASIAGDSWAAAERATQEIVAKMQPTLGSMRERQEVIDYVQRLIGCCLGCEVFPYGSVPLKTYLLDGDIDLTALCSSNVEEALASDVHAVLKGEEQNENAEFEVKDIQFITAEVKLVKCLVKDIVIDISFNQLGGLSTLCFLEQVDRLIGKDHLFKRSIILIKSWCYYESRILGAHHGLISTYALEILVLYIFHLFHLSLDGPLAVLYRFLDYFSKFDWDNYCISLNGPVCKSSLPDIVAELPENGQDDLLLSEEFLRNCVDMFSVPFRGLETNSRTFPLKHLNIIDPLRENNNLGRSVNKGNFYRIRSAFKYGSHKLGQILSLPREVIQDELKNFFASTLERHRSKYMAEIQNSALTFGSRGSSSSSSSSGTEICSEDEIFLTSLDSDKITRIDDETSSMGVLSSPSLSEMDSSIDGNAVSGYCLSGDSKESASCGFHDLRITEDMSDSLPPTGNLGRSLSVKSHHGHRLYISSLFIENGSLCPKMAESSVIDDASIVLQQESKENHFVANTSFSSHSYHEGHNSIGSIISRPTANISENTALAFRGRDFACNAGSLGSLETLLDLSGDYDSHIRSLQYGQCCYGHALPPPLLPSPPLSPSQLQINTPWDKVRQHLQFTQNLHSQMDSNGVILGNHFPVKHPARSITAFGLEDKQKPRGTGTYFPNMSHLPNRDRPVGQRRNQALESHSQLHRRKHRNGLVAAQQEMNLIEETSHELSQLQYPVLGHGKSIHANGSSLPPKRLEFGSFGTMSSGLPTPDRCTKPDSSGTLPAWGATASPVGSRMQSPKPVLGNEEKRFEGLSYHLKNEDDFPPLSLKMQVDG
ncbi:hypothetical protein VitviT2T_008462 [Vitis vinifera]|uniref:PAP-associated domain-containing protein n=2 Tax=Vitis vinifera TaxID=29760 RepID=F6GUC0_VITVI|nr:uncharacterized protein LOC100253523 isoform X1 [Vitis vinifera]WJZ89233.1 hypothetical protein VitviT2T_008462 [Vitis vinifera]|eukprot:XP_002276607.2 PREDICTED: uncharacterized protein LOC100253523 isoform X1 [Vitis vinifera]